MVLLQSEILLRIAKTGIYTVGERHLFETPPINWTNWYNESRGFSYF